jgi:ABC-type multidrug transport system ATPase subunit
MLVLGRPGSGCTSFLKTVANKRRSFKNITGDVFYGNMSAEEADKHRGTILYNSEGEFLKPLKYNMLIS